MDKCIDEIWLVLEEIVLMQVGYNLGLRKYNFFNVLFRFHKEDHDDPLWEIYSSYLSIQRCQRELEFAIKEQRIKLKPWTVDKKLKKFNL